MAVTITLSYQRGASPKTCWVRDETAGEFLRYTIDHTANSGNQTRLYEVPAGHKYRWREVWYGKERRGEGVAS